MRVIITALVFFLCTAVPVFSEIVIQTKDGRAIRVPVNVNEISRIDFLTNLPSASTNLTPVGSWRNNNASTWTITATPNGGYYAKETGLGNAKGPAYFTESGAFRIDYTWSGGSGFYEVRFAPDYRSAKGFADGPSNTVIWVRINP
jgi:hypothetical protein